MPEKDVDPVERWRYDDDLLVGLGFHVCFRGFEAAVAGQNDIFQWNFTYPPAPTIIVHMYGVAGCQVDLDFRLHACDCTEIYNIHTGNFSHNGVALDAAGALTLYCLDITADLGAAGVGVGDIVGMEMEVSDVSGANWFYLQGLCVQNAQFCVLHGV